MAEVELCGHRIKLDDDDVERVMSRSWCAVDYGEGELIFYGRDLRDGRSVRVRLQRFIMNTQESKITRRRAGSDPLDYRKACFTILSADTAAANLGKRKGLMTSRFKGVSLDRRSGRWIASIRPNGLSIYLGIFDSEEDAAEAYNAAAIRYFGENAFQNAV